MTDNMKKLMEVVSNDEQLGERLSKISDKAELIAEVKALGLDISEADRPPRPAASCRTTSCWRSQAASGAAAY